MTIDVLKNRIEAMNTLHAYANQIIPGLFETVEKTGLPRKKDGTLTKRVKDTLESHICNMPRSTRAYIFSNEYHAGVTFNINYQVTEHSVSYYEFSVYFQKGKTWQAMPIYSVEDMRVQDAMVAGMEQEIELLQSEVRAITYITRGR